MSEGAKSAKASERLVSLSQPKEFLPDYHLPKMPFEAVSETAKEAKASERVCELAKPKRVYEKDYEVTFHSVSSANQ